MFTTRLTACTTTVRVLPHLLLVSYLETEVENPFGLVSILPSEKVPYMEVGGIPGVHYRDTNARKQPPQKYFLIFLF